MSDEPEEGDLYLPEPREIGDGAVLLADPVEFFEFTNSLAAIVMDGGLYVLRRDTGKWVNVESLAKQPATAKLAKVKG